LEKRFGYLVALKDISFSQPEGQILVLLGPNGAGKSTLIRILATLLRPTKGAIRIGGYDGLQDGAKIRRILGVVSHQTFLYEELTAFENLEFYARMYGISNAPERISEVLHWMGLYNRRHDRVRNYSRGMLQRLSLARSILHNPQVLLLDEPFTGLDVKACESLLEFLHTWRDQGKTILLATHHIERSVDLADRFLVLRQGRLVSDVPNSTAQVEELIENYRMWTERGPE